MARIGYQMARAAAIVAAEAGAEGLVMYSVAKRLHIGARLGTNCACGYNPIHRAIKAGLIVRKNGKLFPVEVSRVERDAFDRADADMANRILLAQESL